MLALRQAQGERRISAGERIFLSEGRAEPLGEGVGDEVVAAHETASSIPHARAREPRFAIECLVERLERDGVRADLSFGASSSRRPRCTKGTALAAAYPALSLRQPAT